jgi:CDP-diacylglycerol--serine O-phosphatidyltransferase
LEGDDIRDFLTFANALTTAGLAAGFLALLAVIDGHLPQAAAWVALAAVFDSLDGVVARRSGEDPRFGGNLDSLADLLSFGVVPAVGLHLGPFQPVSILGLLFGLCFLVAGAWRLARFPLVKRGHCFVGLPIPAAGVVLMFTLLWRPGPSLSLVLTLILSALMVSTLPFPTLHGVRHRSTAILGAYSRRLRR